MCVVVDQKTFNTRCALSRLPDDRRGARVVVADLYKRNPQEQIRNVDRHLVAVVGDISHYKAQAGRENEEVSPNTTRETGIGSSSWFQVLQSFRGYNAINT